MLNVHALFHGSMRRGVVGSPGAGMAESSLTNEAAAVEAVRPGVEPEAERDGKRGGYAEERVGREAPAAGLREAARRN